MISTQWLCDSLQASPLALIEMATFVHLKSSKQGYLLEITYMLKGPATKEWQESRQEMGIGETKAKWRIEKWKKKKAIKCIYGAPNISS
jgi:hypothetical protein